MRKKNQEIERKTINGGGGWGMETLGILWHEKKIKFGYKHGCSK